MILFKVGTPVVCTVLKKQIFGAIVEVETRSSGIFATYKIEWSNGLIDWYTGENVFAYVKHANAQVNNVNGN